MTITVDDAQLLRLAAAHPHDAAPVLDRSAVFWPLVVLLAVVPGLLVILQSPLDEDWGTRGLRALDVQQAATLQDWVQPGRTSVPPAWNHRAPLSSWLTASILALFPPGAAWSLFLVGYLSVVGLIAITVLWVTEAAGPRLAFLAAVCLAIHPQLLWTLAHSPEDALTTCLLVTATWGLWGHLTTAGSIVSWRLLCAGIAWGLAVLAGGPVAMIWLLVAAIWTLTWPRPTSEQPVASADGWTIVRPQPLWSAAIIFATGMALCGWWLAALLSIDGWDFLADWWIGLTATDVQNRWGLVRIWLCRSAWIGGWWFLGLQDALRRASSTQPASERQFLRWLVWWTAGGIVGVGLRLIDPTVIAEGLLPWESLLLVPATLLSAHGLNRALRREVDHVSLLLASLITLGGVSWLLTGRLSIGLIVAGAAGLVVAASAPVAWSLRGTSQAWSESEVRVWVRGAALVTLLGHALNAWPLMSSTSPERHQWSQVRIQLSALGPIAHTSLIAPGGVDLPQWEFLRRSLWPHAVATRASGWDPKLTERIAAEADEPRSRILLLECHRRGLRIQADVGTGWQFSPVVEPQLYRGRRLAAHLIAPMPQ